MAGYKLQNLHTVFIGRKDSRAEIDPDSNTVHMHATENKSHFQQWQKMSQIMTFRKIAILTIDIEFAYSAS